MKEKLNYTLETLSEDLNYVSIFLRELTQVERTANKGTTGTGKIIWDILLNGFFIFSTGATGFAVKESVNAIRYKLIEKKELRKAIRELFFSLVTLYAYMDCFPDMNFAKLLSEGNWASNLDRIHNSCVHDIALMEPEERLELIKKICDKQAELLIKLEDTDVEDQALERIMFGKFQQVKKVIMPKLFSKEQN